MAWSLSVDRQPHAVCLDFASMDEWIVPSALSGSTGVMILFFPNREWPLAVYLTVLIPSSKPHTLQYSFSPEDQSDSHICHLAFSAAGLPWELHHLSRRVRFRSMPSMPGFRPLR
jgi:hypothetical protein